MTTTEAVVWILQKSFITFQLVHYGGAERKKVLMQDCTTCSMEHYFSLHKKKKKNLNPHSAI